MAFANVARYELAVETVDAVRDLLGKLRAEDTYLAQHPSVSARLAAIHGLFCADLVTLLRTGNKLVLDDNPVLVNGDRETPTQGPRGLPRHWPVIEIELGMLVVGGVVEWKSHAAVG